MNLDWYRGIEPVLTLDPCYSFNHVAAFRSLNSKKSKNDGSNSLNHPTPGEPPKENFLIHNGFKKRIPSQSTQPLGSKIFTPYVVMKILKSRFKQSWINCINTSRKLEFYREAKDTFTKESYLDHVNRYSDRINITKLRISAHSLEIETGRHNNTPREERICSWCKITLGTDNIEDESHFLSYCDLNAVSRRNTFNKIRSIISNNIQKVQPTIIL